MELVQLMELSELTGLAGEGIVFPWTNRKNTASNVSLEYFLTIGRERTHRLWQIYQIDFEMFGYQAEEYFRIHQPVSQQST